MHKDQGSLMQMIFKKLKHKLILIMILNQSSV